MNISIFGGGWLGQPLASKLSGARGTVNRHSPNQYHVRVTARSEQSVLMLKELGLVAYPFTLGQSLTEHRDLTALLDNDVVIINIPPGRRNLANDPRASQIFIDNMCALIQQTCIENSAQLIFISTSAVYGDAQGYITEHNKVAPVTESARAHQAVESFILQQIPHSACILRLAGLVGPGRHPGMFLAGKHEVSAGGQVVNLIHQQDVISALEKIILSKTWGEVLHLSAQAHPSRREYYTWAAQQLGLAAPHFAYEVECLQGKWIDASYTLQKLSLSLTYPSPYDML
ncbi:NAD-dependent epimerase/dehydratase family protein [Paraglaciecola polaris]|uniref:dTDP-4-dehydrorhamnose reductase n=1 Tax=Paraglaciecola polaris LMG 21857 TaxID=1129793 RepID=K6ZX93_9ALTE|nr:NAD-dependent epimerase/dehydratase family protein [Paraglaciecola polaris]GAC34837.1 dTDP-4-dehydrorhamnose reductase [Paraglaciecola polaris LMG 21857]